jgi:hypothetical protein
MGKQHPTTTSPTTREKITSKFLTMRITTLKHPRSHASALFVVIFLLRASLHDGPRQQSTETNRAVHKQHKKKDGGKMRKKTGENEGEKKNKLI